MNYYNEWDKGAAAWLRELIKAGHIPPGDVDERSITDVAPADLAGYTQCHWFAGIAGWPLALKLAGVPSTVPLWTGSPPCQPFSVAGAGAGKGDARHLAPAFLDLVAECRPQLIFGEQVAAAIGKHWLDDLFTELEAEGYTCGAAVLPACSVGAPHKRDRLFFGAILADSVCKRSERWRSSDSCFEQNQQCEKAIRTREIGAIERFCSSGVLADTNNQHQPTARHTKGVANTDRSGEAFNAANPHNNFWSDADWLGCRDGKFRPVRPGSFPLVDGLSGNLATLRTIETLVILEVENYASSRKIDAGQMLSAVRDYLQQEASRERQSTGVLFELHAPEVLFAFLLSVCAARESRAYGSRIQKADDAPCWTFLRELRIRNELGTASRGRESDERLDRQFADAMLPVSLILARHVEAYRAAAFKAHAANGRVAMLRGAGNAIVPQVAAEFITAFLGARQ